MHVKSKDAEEGAAAEGRPPEGTASATHERAGEAPASRKAEQSLQTSAALIAAARQLFAQRGYADVGTEEIVRAAGVTRGALYHHFAGKRDLFEAVYERIEVELAERIAATALQDNPASPREAMGAGTEMFLAASAEPETQRIVLLDGPSVLGWD